MTDSTPQAPLPGTAGAAPAAAFPPRDIVAFLRFCAGEWLGLRSRFALGEIASSRTTTTAQEPAGEQEGDEWHSSDRGELVVTYLEPSSADSPGSLSVGPKGQRARLLHFRAGGSFTVDGQPAEQQGSWQLWPDGSLELTLRAGGSEVRERIWFTKPNLRLRSTVENHADGTPGRASFSSEIRRVSRPAAPAS